MQTTQIRELTVAAFLPYGHYANLIDPTSEKLGSPPIEFFRDMVQQDLGTAASASGGSDGLLRRGGYPGLICCQVMKRDPLFAHRDQALRGDWGQMMMMQIDSNL